MSAVEGPLARWVALWDEREPPSVLAAIRIALPLVVLADLALIALRGATTWLWAPLAAGGVSSWSPGAAPLFYRVLPESASSAWLLWLGLVLSALGVGAGCFMRASALVYVMLSAQAASINAPADRAIDGAIRIMFLILALSPAAQVWSVDARRRAGSFAGDPSAAPAWPRYLILGQLVLIYWGAGLAKGGTHWYPWGHYRALYLILRDPILAAADFSWIFHPLAYRASQLATALTHVWELAAPLVLLAAHYRRTSDRPGWLRRLFKRLPVRDAYVTIGIVFHLTLALTLRLGIFPFAMIACFPAFFRPDELERLFGRALSAARALVQLDRRRMGV